MAQAVKALSKPEDPKAPQYSGMSYTLYPEGKAVEKAGFNQIRIGGVGEYATPDITLGYAPDFCRYATIDIPMRYEAAIELGKALIEAGEISKAKYANAEADFQREAEEDRKHYENE